MIQSLSQIKIQPNLNQHLRIYSLNRFQRMSSQKMYEEILQKIKAIYVSNDQKANELAASKRVKSGNNVDQQQNNFIGQLKKTEGKVDGFLKAVQKKEKDSSGSDTITIRNYIGTVTLCLTDIRTILKKQQMNFKITKTMFELTEQTSDSIQAVMARLNESDGPCGCFSSSNQTKLSTTFNAFKVVAAKWNTINLFEAKDSVQTFVSPTFKQNDFKFILDILNRNAPEEKIVDIKPTKLLSSRDDELQSANEYVFGIHREQNIWYGLQLYHHQADTSANPKACAFLGRVYEEGNLIQKNLQKAEHYYKKAMQGRNAHATYRYAIGLIKGIFKDGTSNAQKAIKKAFDLLTQISSGVDAYPQALVQLGDLYGYGSFRNDTNNLYTVEKDFKRAISFYVKARNQHLPRASNDLAVLYMNNFREYEQPGTDNASKIQQKVISYLEQAARLGYVQGYYNLGIMYSNNPFEPGARNPSKAIDAFYSGGAKGDVKCKIKFAYELMDATSMMKEQYEEQYELARIWLEKLSYDLRKREKNASSNEKVGLQEQRGEAEYYLGLFYDHGLGVQQSYPQAAYHYLIASNTGMAAGKNKVGDYYLVGKGGFQKNEKAAIGLYVEAAEAGNCDAMVSLGIIWMNGVPGVIEPDYAKAYNNLKEAAKRGSSDALIHLNRMYKAGLFVDKNEVQAKKLLQDAAKMKNPIAFYLLKDQFKSVDNQIHYQNMDEQFQTDLQKIDIDKIVPILPNFKLK